jgi:hypothetical protein
MEREKLIYHQQQEASKPKKPLRVKAAELSRKIDLVQMPIGAVGGFIVAGPIGAVIGAGIPAGQFAVTGWLKDKWIRDEAKKAASQQAMAQEAQKSRGLLRFIDPLRDKVSSLRQPRLLPKAA